MAACRNEVMEILRPLRGGLGAGDAELVEAERAGLLDQPALQVDGVDRIAQKSRST
jgi:hypothetical protein